MKLRVREEHRKKEKENQQKQIENEKGETETINALPHSNSWIIRRKGKKVAPS